MEMKLRQRIIGAVVVAALAIIFIPLLFKSSSPSTASNQPTTIKMAAEIPPEPAKPVTPQMIAMNQDKGLNAASSDEPATMNNAESGALKATTTAQNTSPQAIAPSDDIMTDEPATTVQPTKTATTTVEPTHPSSSNKKTTKHTTKQPSKHTTHHTTTKVATTTSSATTKHSTDKKTKPTTMASAANTTSPTAGMAWIVQLGSFANATSAKQLETELRSHGFKAYTQNIKTSLGTLIRVAIGPEVKREKADAIKDRLAKEMQIKSIVVAYNPTGENT